eukprot:TRINITY_DN61854_c0_g1_i1.p2 TRINITY_DN61854_c0_g1~~TRINITY_DN61854_c0_g1_i1.p2  ORF type:complete len:103 (+),score=28.36 TRINITY_DN61854_c0_g1_i1:31-309(+)
MLRSLVGSEMCIRDRLTIDPKQFDQELQGTVRRDQLSLPGLTIGEMGWDCEHCLLAKCHGGNGQIESLDHSTRTVSEVERTSLLPNNQSPNL